MRSTTSDKNRQKERNCQPPLKTLSWASTLKAATYVSQNCQRAAVDVVKRCHDCQKVVTNVKKRTNMYYQNGPPVDIGYNTYSKCQTPETRAVFMINMQYVIEVFSQWHASNKRSTILGIRTAKKVRRMKYPTTMCGLVYRTPTPIKKCQILHATSLTDHVARCRF